MLYDLNIAWSPSTTKDQLLKTLRLASSLGYTTVALNTTLTLPLPTTPAAPFPPLEDLSASDSNNNEPSFSSSSSGAAGRLPSILHRATVPLGDPAASNYRLPQLASAFDLIAVRPTTDKGFQNACLTLDVPLISLDLTQHFPFHFRPKPCMAAVARGVRFEVCYAQALAADPRGRANFIGNVAALVRATRGRGLVLASEARDPLSLRAPADVVNLLSVWGLSSDKGQRGLDAIPRSVVVNEGIKRTGFRGVIDIVQVAERKEEPSKEGQEKQTEAQNGKKNKNKGQHQNQNQKRKNGDEDTQSISKRQAKKMRIAAREKK